MRLLSKMNMGYFAKQTNINCSDHFTIVLLTKFRTYDFPDIKIKRITVKYTYRTEERLINRTTTLCEFTNNILS